MPFRKCRNLELNGMERKKQQGLSEKIKHRMLGRDASWTVVKMAHQAFRGVGSFLGRFFDL